MPETLLLRTFLAVAAGLSFRKAAAELHVAPSTVTSRIMALEQELGVRLFVRKSRSVALTGAGQRLFWHAAHLVELARRTRQVAAGERDVPEVRLRVSETLGAWCLPPVLGRFRQAYPTARVHLATASREGLVRDVRRGSVDAALLMGEPFSAPGIVVESLGRERLVVCTGPEGPLADRESVGPDDLADAPLVLTRRVWSARPLLERRLAGEGGLAGYVECDGSRIARRLAEAAGVDILFAPEPAAMYAPDASTFVTVEGVSAGLCGASRPTHFRGVATVVTKLFMLAQPSFAVFGEKDRQQLAVIARMVRDLDIPVTVVGRPIVREADGLALSSRNVFLTREERGQAPWINKALEAAAALAASGIRETATILSAARDILAAHAPLGAVDYLEAVDPDTMQPVTRVEGPVVLAAAVRFSGARLIDNRLAGPPEAA